MSSAEILREQRLLANAIARVSPDSSVSGNELSEALAALSDRDLRELKRMREHFNVMQSPMTPIELITNFVRGADGLDSRWEFDPSVTDSLIGLLTSERFPNRSLSLRGFIN